MTTLTVLYERKLNIVDKTQHSQINIYVIFIFQYTHKRLWCGGCSTQHRLYIINMKMSTGSSVSKSLDSEHRRRALRLRGVDLQRRRISKQHSQLLGFRWLTAREKENQAGSRAGAECETLPAEVRWTSHTHTHTHLHTYCTSSTYWNTTTYIALVNQFIWNTSGGSTCLCRFINIVCRVFHEIHLVSLPVKAVFG